MARTMPTGLLGMFRADSLSALADGASVTSWADTVGTRVLVTRNAAPTKVAVGGANSQPAVRFNGNSQDLKMDAPPIVAQPNTIFVVMTARSITASERAILWQGGQDIGIANNGAPAIWAGVFVSSSLTVSANAPAALTFLADGSADSAIYVNGSLGAKANVGGGQLDGNFLTIGSHGTIGSRYMEMDLYELRIYDHDLTAAERQTLHSYAQDRYGITVSDYVADNTTVPITGTLRVFDRWNGAALVRIKHERWTGTALTTRLLERFDAVITPPATPTGPTTGSSTPARWVIPFGGVPTVRATWETGVNSNGKAQVTWVSSMPDARARTSKLETGVLAQAQDAFQATIVDTTNSTTVVDSGVVTGAAESWVATSFVPVAGRTYRGTVRVRAADGQWSTVASTRFVAPSGRTLYFEDYGAVGDGTTLSGTDYANAIYTGPIRQALAAAQPGDVVRSKNPGTVLTGLTSAGTALSSSAVVFTAAMVGKKIIVYRGGTTDATSNSWAHRTTVSAVAADGKSATLAAPVLTNGTGITAVVGYAEYLTGHMDIDGGLGAPGNGGGWTLDGTGCVFTSTDVDHSGFRTIIPDVTYRNVHYWQKTQTTRGNGLNNNTGPFFIEGPAVVGMRLIGCYAERARDAGFLIYNGSSDIHIVDCVADHTNADGFHVTGSAHDVQFIRTRNAYIGDDAVANIGYRSDGDAARPYNITWENPEIYGQDWGRGVSFGGCYHCLVTDMYIERGAGTSFILGSDGDMANTSDIQIRRVTVVSPNLRRGLKPTYSQGSATGSVIPDEPWLKLLNSSSATQQGPIMLEDVTVTDGRYIQIISYGGGAFTDSQIILRGVAMTGATNAGTNWVDQGTYPGHIDLRGITVPAGSTAVTTAPANPNS